MNKDNETLNKPTYKIYGLERRKLKKELSILKLQIKNFWYYYQLDKDMCSFFNCDESWLGSDKEMKIKYDKMCTDAQSIESELSELYII